MNQLRDRIADAALNWYELQLHFHQTPRNLEAGEKMGQAELELRAACTAFFEECRRIARSHVEPDEAIRRELLMGAPDERPAHPYESGGDHD